MGLIREPLDVDFYVDQKPLTDEDRLLISEFIQRQKSKKAKSATPTKKDAARCISLPRKKKEFA